MMYSFDVLICAHLSQIESYGYLARMLLKSISHPFCLHPNTPLLVKNSAVEDIVLSPRRPT